MKIKLNFFAQISLIFLLNYHMTTITAEKIRNNEIALAALQELLLRPTSVCSICKIKTKKPSILKTHLFTHMETGLFPCNQLNFNGTPCTKKFKRPDNLDIHIKERHQNLHPHKCKICGKRFKRNYQWKKHLDSEHREPLPSEKLAEEKKEPTISDSNQFPWEEILGPTATTPLPLTQNSSYLGILSEQEMDYMIKTILGSSTTLERVGGENGADYPETA